MKSWLTVESATLEEVLLTKHLQLRGIVVDGIWRFEMAKRLTARSGAQHVQYWVNLLQKHAEGRRALQRLGYEFCLHFSVVPNMPLRITADEIDALARVRCGLVFENGD